MKTNTTKQIVKLINERPELKAGEIIKATGIEDARVYRTLSYLVKTKKLSRRGGKYTIAYGLPMTAITPTQEVAPKNVEQSKQIASLQFEVDKQGELIKSLREQNEDLKREVMAMNVSYFDAKAVIKYLEQKLENGNA